MWWIKNTPVPVPIITGGNPNDNIPGGLGQPGTRVLFGGSSVDEGMFSGGRFVLGSWLDADDRVGVEGTFFFLGRNASRFTAASDATGTPALFRAVFNVVDQVERPGVISSPGLLAGSGSVVTSSQVWGTEVNGLVNLGRDGSWSADLLGGFRYLDLRERLDAPYQKTVVPGGNDIFLGTPVNPGDSLSVSDSFNTRNQFYGGQIGGRVGYRGDRLSLDVLGKVALGVSHEVVDINGQTTLVTAGGTTAGAVGGQLALPSNIGRRSQDVFAVVPEVGLTVGYQVTRNLKATAGYTFLYNSDVVRPGDQIDRGINPAQFPTSFLFVPGAAVPARPAPLFNHNDFWAQGINLGLERSF